MINSRDAEPWTYGEEVEQISRNYIKFRYQLLPYIYSLFYEASINGMPVQRSLAISFTHDNKVYEGQFQHEYLFGPSILVAPVESNKEFVKVYLPSADSWYYVYNGNRFSGNTEVIIECPLHRLPIFIKAGAIIPMQKSAAHTGEKNDQIIVHIYAGNSRSSFVFYEDDGATFDYQKNRFAKRLIEYDPHEKSIIFRNTDGDYKTDLKKLKLVLHGFDGAISSVNVNQLTRSISKTMNRFFTGLEKFDPIKDPEPAPEENVLVTEFDYTPGEIVIQW
jgi:alpha-glucosidase